MLFRRVLACKIGPYDFRNSEVIEVTDEAWAKRLQEQRFKQYVLPVEEWEAIYGKKEASEKKVSLYDKMSRADLVHAAASRGLKDAQKMKKEELINWLEQNPHKVEEE